MIEIKRTIRKKIDLAYLGIERVLSTFDTEWQAFLMIFQLLEISANLTGKFHKGTCVRALQSHSHLVESDGHSVSV